VVAAREAVGNEEKRETQWFRKLKSTIS